MPLASRLERVRGTETPSRRPHFTLYPGEWVEIMECLPALCFAECIDRSLTARSENDVVDIDGTRRRSWPLQDGRADGVGIDRVREFHKPFRALVLFRYEECQVADSLVDHLNCRLLANRAISGLCQPEVTSSSRVSACTVGDDRRARNHANVVACAVGILASNRGGTGVLCTVIVHLPRSCSPDIGGLRQS